MRCPFPRLWLLSIICSILWLPQHASGREYLTKDAALRLVFGAGATVNMQTVTATPAQQAQIKQLAQATYARPDLTYYTGMKDDRILGHAVIATVPGKADPIAFLLAVDPQGAVMAVEILSHDDAKAGLVRQKSFLKQFVGKTSKDKLRVKEDITHAAGATISSRAITDGVRLYLAYLSVLLPQPAAAAAPAETAPVTRSQFVMGTTLEITAYAPTVEAGNQAITRAFAEVARLDAIFSTFRPESEVSQLNRVAANHPHPVSADLLALLKRAQQFSTLTNGAFDVTVAPLVALWRQAAKDNTPPTPHAMAAAQEQTGMRHLVLEEKATSVRLLRDGVQTDFGGIAKGYALDSAARVLSANGVTAALLNFGGQVLAAGLPPGQTHWTVTVRDPRTPETAITTLRLTAGSVATSADYERGLTIREQRYSHIIDPRSGRPVTGMLGVTVIAPTATEADALSTGLFALGMAEGQRLAAQEQLAVLLVAEGQPIFRSPTFHAQEAPPANTLAPPR